MLVEEFLQQRDYLVAAPRPAAERPGIQAALVDVEDDDAVIDRPRHGKPQPVIVDDVFELGDETYLVERRGVAYE